MNSYEESSILINKIPELQNNIRELKEENIALINKNKELQSYIDNLENNCHAPKFNTNQEVRVISSGYISKIFKIEKTLNSVFMYHVSIPIIGMPYRTVLVTENDIEAIDPQCAAPV